MQVEHQQALKEILTDLHFLLENHSKNLIWSFSHENDPLSYDLSFIPAVSDTPAVSEKTFKSFFNADACTLCNRRISYKRNQWEKKYPAEPYLVLVHNTFLGNHSRVYHDPEIDKEFHNIFKKGTAKESSDFLIREVLRCHLGAEDVSQKEYISNCTVHIKNDIKEFGLKGILILGEAAPLLFKEKVKLENRLNKVSDFMRLPTVVTAGPSRLVFMRQKGFPGKRILLEEQKILKSLELFASDVMEKG